VNNLEESIFLSTATFTALEMNKVHLHLPEREASRQTTHSVNIYWGCLYPPCFPSHYDPFLRVFYERGEGGLDRIYLSSILFSPQGLTGGIL
jgi:hypothetical protein